MSEARKCDRCSSYFEYDDNMNNYIVFGNKHIIVDLKKGKNFDICPKCMKEFEDWLWPSEEEPPVITDPECCGDCPNCDHSYSARYEIDRTVIVGCRHYHKRLTYSFDEPCFPITPDTFIKDEKYEDPCKSCHNGVCEQCDYSYCSEEEKKKRWLENHKKEVKLQDPYEEGGL